MTLRPQTGTPRVVPNTLRESIYRDPLVRRELQTVGSVLEAFRARPEQDLQAAAELLNVLAREFVKANVGPADLEIRFAEARARMHDIIDVAILPLPNDETRTAEGEGPSLTDILVRIFALSNVLNSLVISYRIGRYHQER